tara:strand:- start:84766 stop:85884 length:1119 start_codon:yes stop_codon:yes gene_type:complete
MSQRCYYEILSVSKTVEQGDIKKSFRRLAMKYHPDRNPGDAEAEANFKEVKEAYEILSDPQKRQMYDRFGHAGVNQQAGPGPGAGAGGFGDIFGDMFGDIFGGGRRGGGGGPRPEAGSDLRYGLEITLEEAVHGFEKEITVPNFTACGDCKGSGAKKGTTPKTCADCGGSGQLIMQQGFMTIQQTCPSCQGAGQSAEACGKCHGQGRVRESKDLSVKIPAGVDDGDRVRLAGEGEAGLHGGPTGDLYVQVSVKKHEIFERDGADLHCEVPVTYATCVLGGEIEVPTLDGKATIKIPAETQSGKSFRLRGKGVRSIRNATQGDLFCRVNVEIPVKLSQTQKDHLQEFEQMLDDGKDHRPHSKSWFKKVKAFFE